MSQHKVSPQDHSLLADTPWPENKNSFEFLEEDEAQESESVNVPEQGIPGPLGSLEAAKQASPKPASLGSKKDPNTLVHETPAQERLASSVPSSEGTSESEDFSARSPPLTRGRKTNKENREKEAASNINLGSQKKLDHFIKGYSSPPISCFVYVFFSAHNS